MDKTAGRDLSLHDVGGIGCLSDSPSSRLCSINGPFQDFLENLKTRGWTVVPEAQKDVVWRFVLRRKEIKWMDVPPYCWINQFPNSEEITRKNNLLATLLRHAKDSHLMFFPRCYNLSSGEEFSAFLDDYRISSALAVLGRFSTGDERVAPSVAQLAGRVCRAWLLISDAALQGLSAQGAALPGFAAGTWSGRLDHALSTSQWNQLFVCARCVDPAVASSAASATAVGSRSRVSEAKKGSFAQFRQRLSAAASAPAAEAEIKASSEQTAPRLGTQTDGVSPVATAPQLTDAATSIPVVSEPVSSDADRRQRAAHLCFSVVARLPQPALDAVRNVWIVKPGIEVVSALDDVTRHRRAHGTQPYIVQKYLERPLLIEGRKFDIRQWVLVTSFQPLTVYFYRRCYLRFCVEQFDLGDLSNRFRHLCNNSVQKHSTAYDAAEVAVQSMWSSTRFSEYLGGETWLATIQPSLKRVVAAVMRAASAVIESRPRSYELFGFDLMLDSELRPWLCEVNKCPTLEHSTPVTTDLCTRVVADTCALMADHVMAGLTPNSVGEWDRLDCDGV